jgi:hypothetical protein
VQAFEPRWVLDHAERAEALLARTPVLGGKLEKACGIAPSECTQALTEVLRFLSLTQMSERQLTPSERVDLAWHEFILCTRQYADYCARYLGRFVHHDPGGSDASHRVQFLETIRLYNLCFGTPDPRWWEGPNSPQAAIANCGPCESGG